MKTIMYIITHKKYNFPTLGEYIPLVVGANKNKVEISGIVQYDNTGDNISDKNSSFCELTGLYWIYKNSTIDGIVGLSHYRRYFFKSKKVNLANIVDKKYIEQKLTNADIILPKKKYLIDGNVYNDYKAHHNIKDLDNCISIIEKKYPDYKEATSIIMKRNYLHSFNMFATKKALIDKYCEWLFDVLFELEKETDISKYDDYNKRIYGFLSERLFNIWVLKNNLKICEVDVYNIEENASKENMINLIKRISLLPIIRIITKKVVDRKRAGR